MGEVVGDGVRLMYDYGDFTWDLDRSHTVFDESIGGIEANILGADLRLKRHDRRIPRRSGWRQIQPYRRGSYPGAAEGGCGNLSRHPRFRSVKGSPSLNGGLDTPGLRVI